MIPKKRLKGHLPDARALLECFSEKSSLKGKGIFCVSVLRNLSAISSREQRKRAKWGRLLNLQKLVQCFFYDSVQFSERSFLKDLFRLSEPDLVREKVVLCRR
jgi:hypothetical protein